MILKGLTQGWFFLSPIDGVSPLLFIGAFHGIYNIGFVLLGLFLPYPLLALSRKVFPDPRVKESQVLKTPINLNSLPPSLAIEQAQQEVRKMSAMVMSLMELALSEEVHEPEAERVIKYELITDNIEAELSEFSKRIFQIPLTDNQVNEMLSLLRTSEKLEKLGNHGKEVLLLRRKLERGRDVDSSFLVLYQKLHLGIEKVFSSFARNLLGLNRDERGVGSGSDLGEVGTRQDFERARLAMGAFGVQDQELSSDILMHLGAIDRLTHQMWESLPLS